MDKSIERIVAFNSFYFRYLNDITKALNESNLSVSEATVLTELVKHDQCNARKIIAALGMDEGYVSRIIRRLSELDLVIKQGQESDRRVNIILLTPKGKKALQKINKAMATRIEKWTAGVSAQDLQMLLLMMDGIQNILGKNKFPGNGND